MAGNQAAIINYYTNVLRIADADARDALVLHGLDSFASFANIAHKDIEETCKACRSPGGTKPNPAYNANTNPNVSQTIPDPGVFIGRSTVKLLQKLHYFVLHMNRVGREANAASATLQRLATFWEGLQQIIPSVMSGRWRLNFKCVT